MRLAYSSSPKASLVDGEEAAGRSRAPIGRQHSEGARDRCEYGIALIAGKKPNCHRDIHIFEACIDHQDREPVGATICIGLAHRRLYAAQLGRRVIGQKHRQFEERNILLCVPDGERLLDTGHASASYSKSLRLTTRPSSSHAAWCRLTHMRGIFVGRAASDLFIEPELA